MGREECRCVDGVTLDLNADPTAPFWWWNDFVDTYKRTNESYISRFVCHTNRLNEKNPTAQAQWGAWLMYVINRRMTE